MEDTAITTTVLIPEEERSNEKTMITDEERSKEKTTITDEEIYTMIGKEGATEMTTARIETDIETDQGTMTVK